MNEDNESTRAIDCTISSYEQQINYKKIKNPNYKI